MLYLTSSLLKKILLYSLHTALERPRAWGADWPMFESCSALTSSVASTDSLSFPEPQFPQL